MRMKMMLAGGALALGLSGPLFAAEVDVQSEIRELRQQVQSQAREIQELKANEGQNWLNEQRREEIKSLIHEVLADAETRASFQEGGLQAGWNDNFYLASEDGNFLLRVSGQGQIRYMYNHAKKAIDAFVIQTTTDEEGDIISREIVLGGFTGSHPDGRADSHQSGFQVRRAKVLFDGHIFGRELTYALGLNTLVQDGEERDLIRDSSDGSTISYWYSGGPNVGMYDATSGLVFLEDLWIAYEFADGWQVKLGQFKGPFLRDEAVHSSRQLAVERGFVTDLFTVDYTQGIQLTYNGEITDKPYRILGMLHDGSYQANTDFDDDATHIAATARAELLLAGTWKQFEDYASWSGDDLGVMVGAAFDYEEGDIGDGYETYDLYKWTVDASVEVPDLSGLTLMGALIGQHLDTDSNFPGVDHDADQLAWMLQAGIFVLPERMDVFARWEYADLDNTVFVNRSGDADIFGGTGLQNAWIYRIDKELFDEEIQLLTFGTNYYFKKHGAKATFDVVWAMDELPISNTGAGLRAASEDQITLRAQFQFLF